MSHAFDTAGQQAPILDLSRLDAALGGDMDMIKEILQMYLDTTSGDVAQLEQVIQTGQADAIVRVAHGIKGASGNVGADLAMTCAAVIEKAARSGDVQTAAAAWPSMKTAFEQTQQAIAAAM